MWREDNNPRGNGSGCFIWVGVEVMENHARDDAEKSGIELVPKRELLWCL